MSADSLGGLLSSGDKYRKEWQNLLSCLDNDNIDKLKSLAFNGDLKISKFRSICWAILLRVLSSNSNDWIEQRQQQRQRYMKLKSEFLINPHTETIVNDDPLSQSEESVWNQYFDDQNLSTAIKQDVVRTFPGVEFFRKSNIQNSMTNILFQYAREHPYMCYRQGMHEILAPILFVIYYDQQSLLHFIEISEKIDNLLLVVLNPDYFESDSYFLFSRIMSSIESYYKITNFKPTADGYFPMQTKFNNEETSATTEVVIIGQLNLIRDKILAKEDEHLHNHLLKLDIHMHIFGIRWLRVLFGREFPFLDLLMLWDAIFADGDRFDLPNYIVVAMLIRIRDKLILSDYTTSLMHLMKYPSNADIGTILRHALHLQMPKKFERPSNAFVYVSIPPDNPKKTIMSNVKNSKNQTLLGRQNPISDTTTSNHTLSQQRKSSFEAVEQQKTRTLSHLNTESKINSQSQVQLNSKTNQQHSKITELQYTHAMNSARLQKIKASQSAGDNVIIDGLSEDSPEYLRLELQNAQTIITVSQLKLNKYLNTLRKYISRKSPEDLNQAIDGIEELVAFLDVKFSIPSTDDMPRVDAALEAISDPLSSFVAVAEKGNTSSLSLQTIKTTQKSRKNQMTDAEAKTEFVKILEAKKSNPYEVEIGEDGNTLAFKVNPNYESHHKKITVATAASPSNINITNKSPVGGTRYEIPDDSFMKNSLRVLGTRMNVELTLFKEEYAENNDGIPIPDPLGARN